MARQYRMKPGKKIHFMPPAYTSFIRIVTNGLYHTTVIPGSRPHAGYGWEKRKEQYYLNQSYKAPNGMDGFSALRFYDILEDGFRWEGEWIKDISKFY